MRTKYALVLTLVTAMCLSTAIAQVPEKKQSVVRLKNAPLVLTERDVAEGRAAAAAEAKNGFANRMTELSDIDFALQRIQEREQQAADEFQRSGKMSTVKSLGFARVGTDAEPALPFQLAAVPSDFALPNSKNYVIPGGQRVTRVFTHTRLGPVLIREMNNATVYSDAPTDVRTYVGGFPVYMKTARFFGGRWVTQILASKGSRVVEIHVGSRIVAPAQKAQLETLVNSVLAGG